jgi:putative endonuclease
MPSVASAQDGRFFHARASDGLRLELLAEGSALMFYVYMLQSEARPDERYTGFTTDLKQRLKKHNEGASIHTAKYRPWRLVSYLAFENERRAREFEHYLKSGSGKAFANKRFW